MANNNSSHYLMPTFDSEEAFNAYFAKETAAVAPYRDSQGHLVLDVQKGASKKAASTLYLLLYRCISLKWESECGIIKVSTF